jgi:tubulin-folding cofactor B
MKIFVIDLDPSNTVKQLTDTSNEVERFTLSDEDYNKREGTYRKWKEEHPDAVPTKKKESDYSTIPENIKIGNHGRDRSYL